MRPPKISIIMPVYNRSHMIQDAVRSCIDQTFKDWELIVVDDGSDDRDVLIKKLQAFDDERIKYRRIDHTGYISQVRNYGNKIAEADIIVVHDSDDMAFPDRLEEIYKAFQENDVDIVHHGMYLRMWDDKHDAVARSIKKAEKYDKERLLTEQYIPGQVAYKKAIISKYPYDNRIQVCDDWQMLMELALNGAKFHMIDKQLYEYVMHDGSANIDGEMSGKRREDTKIIISILRDKYKRKASALLNRHLITPDFKQGELIKSEIVE